ncbi:hypothetical protein [Actinophytocola gossypii]|uniref:WXG100 family type VII secretion target n=1 Tax=Actinophytocola gossypii TaxID=2812003 RepID=A0ABT2JAU8_9PSEU|nr:hypothetical protein [Actinophytocola gossypii]MCT2584998.1 hypothetical protein [Actinophytocola gossypii]
MTIKHANPYLYATDLRDAMAAFDSALLERYRADLDDHMQVWTPHGEEPDPKPTASAGPGPDTVSIGYNRAKENAPGWVTEVRAQVEPMIAVYDSQDLSKLESAFNDLHAAAALLGERSAVGDDSGLPTLTNKINGRSGDADDFTKWAGISGEAFRNNFGQTVDPTMENQADLATSLLNLYDGRACIIDAARSNTLTAFQRATEKIRETVASGEENARWAFVNVAIIAVGFASAGAGAVLAGGAIIGGYLDSKNPDQKYANEIKDVVVGLMTDLGQAGIDAHTAENEWFGKVTELQRSIASVPSAELELYDFSGQTANSSAPPAGGFEVSVEQVDKLAQYCFEASEEYERVLGKVLGTDAADGELTGENDVETAGDQELKDTRDSLISFLRTTCARYYEAGSRLHDTAREYYGVETDNEAVMRALEKGPDLNGSDHGNGGSVDRHIEKSDRSDIEDLKDYEEPPPPPGGPSGAY